jgi:CsoR family transcriptional regulator, copper-sensing transcriptional repressor
MCSAGLPRIPGMPDLLCLIEDCNMSALTDETHRVDLLNRLKRAEGQLRGIQRMIAEGDSCVDVISQMAAVRKALDSACVRMTVCYMNQELQSRRGVDKRKGDDFGPLLEDVQALLAKVI